MKSKKLAIFILSLTLFVTPFFVFADEATNAIIELNQQLQEKKEEADNIKGDISKFKREITKLQGEADSLKTRLNILDSGINRTKKEIQLSELQIQETEIEISDLTKQIKTKENEITRKKDEIKDLLRQVNTLDEDYISNEEGSASGIFDVVVKFVKIVVKFDSWADYSNTLDSSKKINKALATKKKNLEGLKITLEDNKENLETKFEKLNEQKSNLEVKQKVLGEEQEAKEILLDETKSNEKTYQKLLKEAVEREQALASQVAKLEKEVIERLRALNASNPFASMIWPVPKNVITTAFGGPGYLQSQHNAIDVRVSPGTPIIAPANGIVVAAVTRNGNACKSRRVYCDYSYVKIAHTEAITSLSLHMNSVTVSNGQEVKAGDIIGYSGGTPRAPGTGYFIYPSVPASTGPHLHFAVVKNGVPVNPLNYLP